MSIFKNKKEPNGREHSPMKHMLHMIICCGLPVIIIFLLPFIAGISPVMAGVLGIIAPFICPVMMGGMMIMMFHGDKKSCCDKSVEESKKKLPQN